MADVLMFCKNTIETVSFEITKTQIELDTKVENEERKENYATLRKNDNTKQKHLQQNV